MSILEIEAVYKSWVPYESVPTRRLKDEILKLMENPGKEAEEFFAKVIYDYKEGTDVF